MNNKTGNAMYRWVISVAKVWRNEMQLSFTDKGVVLFFFALPLLYPLVYSLIYNPELCRDVPVVVVDDCRTSTTRQFIQDLDASQYVKVYDYAPTVNDARAIVDDHEAYGIVYLPEDFSKKLGRNEQAHVEMYCDMGLLYRYKSLLMGLTEVSQAFGGSGEAPIVTESVALGNTAMGMASAIMPGVLVMVLQQSMILGIIFLAAGSRERRVRYGYDPKAAYAGSIASVVGKMLCYVGIYLMQSIYVLGFVPYFFSFPQQGSPADLAALVIPFLIATSLFAQTVQGIVREREDVFPVVVFTSVIFLFISGLTWPQFATPPAWVALSSCLPSTWAVNGFLAISTNGATAGQQEHAIMMLWLLAAIYFVMACIMHRVREHRNYTKFRK